MQVDEISQLEDDFSDSSFDNGKGIHPKARAADGQLVGIFMTLLPDILSVVSDRLVMVETMVWPCPLRSVGFLYRSSPSVS